MRYQSENAGGEFVFRCKRHSTWEIDMHLHEYSEILYCQSGECDIYVNGVSFLLKENEFLWVPPNYIHNYKSKGANLLCAVFSNDYVPLFNKTLGERKLKVIPISARGAENLFDAIMNASQDDFLTISGYLTLICARVFESATFEDSRPIDEILYQKILFYVSTHFTQDITLYDIAKRFGYNEKYLSHILHEFTGTHFRKLITLYRIDMAKEMLSSKKHINVSSVAEACGFSALNTFNRAFKEMTGVTPTEYKRGTLSSKIAK